MSPVTRGSLTRFLLGACVSALTVACAAGDPTGPAAAAPALSGGSGGGGGGTGAACSNIDKFEAVPGYYPGNKLWGAIWTSVSLRACDRSKTIHGTLTGVQLSPAGPDRAYLPGNLGTPDGIKYLLTTNTTIDWEPIELESQFEITLDIYDQTNALLETRSAIVTTPAPVFTSTTP